MIPLLLALLFAQANAAEVFGTVTGRLRMGDGTPAANMRVMVLAAGDEQTSGMEIVSSALTDRNGRYNLEAVPPGRYYIAAGLVQFPSYYPGVKTRTEADLITIAPRAALELDFAVATLRVSGRIVRSNAQPLRVGSGNEVRLILGFGQFLTAEVEEDGTYVFPNVPPGNFTLAARPPLTAAATSVVVVDQDVTGANLVVTPVKVVQGRIIVDGGGPPPRFAFNMLEAAPKPGAPPTPVKLMISTERLFTLRLKEGEQPLSIAPESLPPGYVVKSLRYGRIDLLKQPLRIEMADTAELIVTLQGPGGRRVRVSGRVVPYDASMPTAVIKLESSSFVTTPTALVREDGSFRLTDVTPGQYTLTSNLSGASSRPLVVGSSDIENVEITIPSPRTADPEAVVGSLAWIIYDAFSGAVVDKASGPVRVKDVSLIETGQSGNLSTQKVIALNRQFSLVMNEPLPEFLGAKRGFTFTVRHSDFQTMSHESFRIESPTLAREAQDNVELGIAVAEVVTKRWEVTRMEFLTDFSIPVSHSAMVPRGSPYWRVVILKGSNIAWPSLINGKTVTNLP